MKENRRVKFIGEVEDITRGLPEQKMLIESISRNNSFIITDAVGESLEISMICGGVVHFFYVAISDIEAL